MENTAGLAGSVRQYLSSEAASISIVEQWSPDGSNGTSIILPHKQTGGASGQYLQGSWLRIQKSVRNPKPGEIEWGLWPTVRSDEGDSLRFVMVSMRSRIWHSEMSSLTKNRSSIYKGI